MTTETDYKYLAVTNDGRSEQCAIARTGEYYRNVPATNPVTGARQRVTAVEAYAPMNPTHNSRTFYRNAIASRRGNILAEIHRLQNELNFLDAVGPFYVAEIAKEYNDRQKAEREAKEAEKRRNEADARREKDRRIGDALISAVRNFADGRGTASDVGAAARAILADELER